MEAYSNKELQSRQQGAGRQQVQDQCHRQQSEVQRQPVVVEEKQENQTVDHQRQQEEGHKEQHQAKQKENLQMDASCCSEAPQMTAAVLRDICRGIPLEFERIAT